jgi:predicted O-methyltransferase YrrM
MVELAKKLEQPYDLIFIDADKVSYPKYLSLILSLSPISGEKTRMLRPGGLIMADNVLRRALIADASDDNPWSSELKQRGEKVWRDGDMKGLEEFNENLAKDGRMQTFLMPMFDGLGMAILKD